MDEHGRHQCEQQLLIDTQSGWQRKSTIFDLWGRSQLFLEKLTTYGFSYKKITNNANVLKSIHFPYKKTTTTQSSQKIFFHDQWSLFTPLFFTMAHGNEGECSSNRMTNNTNLTKANVLLYQDQINYSTKKLSYRNQHHCPLAFYPHTVDIFFFSCCLMLILT